MATHGYRSSQANLSTHAIDYTILCRRRDYDSHERCLLVSATAFPNRGRPALPIPCAACSNTYDDYYASCFRKASRVFSSDYPFIPPCCVRRVVHNFVLIVEAANARHCCPYVHPGVPPAPTFVIEVHVQPRTRSQSRTHQQQQAMERALRESFEEAARLKVRPATRASVQSLLAAKSSSSMEIEDGGDRQCVICLDKIETPKSALPMPCSHVFHEDCLLHWLSNSHVCPLCRYEMPSQN